MKVRVLVRLKPGILDVQGTSVKRALAGLGFDDVTDLRIGKVIEVDVNTCRRDVPAAPGQSRPGGLHHRVTVVIWGRSFPERRSSTP